MKYKNISSLWPYFPSQATKYLWNYVCENVVQFFKLAVIRATPVSRFEASEESTLEFPPRKLVCCLN